MLVLSVTLAGIFSRESKGYACKICLYCYQHAAHLISFGMVFYYVLFVDWDSPLFLWPETSRNLVVVGKGSLLPCLPGT